MYMKKTKFSNSIRVCVVIFGDGSIDFKRAANRLGEQAKSLGIFSKVAVLDSNSLCDISSRYKADLIKILSLTDYPLYFRAIKPWAILSFMEDLNNPYDVIFYIDAGCEIPNNLVTRYRIKRLIIKTQETGAIAERTGYKETAYSRNNLIEFFGSSDWANTIGQIQSTWSMFKNSELNKRFLKEWIELSDPKYKFWQDPSGPELDSQSPDFIENRWDQSIFSLLYKKYELPTKKTYWEYGGKFGDLRGLSIPIHASRNKTGLSQLPVYQTSGVLSVLSLIFNVVIDFLRPVYVLFKAG
jgi:hypothetical protein